LREWYDRVCVYGDPRIFDARAEYPVPEELRANLEFVGYVGRAVVPERAERVAGAPKQVLVTVGGGEDGYERLSTYLDALELGGCDWESTVVCGPLLDQEQFKTLKRRARRLSGCEITSFHADLPHLLSKSDAVVAMSGYNTSVEIMQSRVPAVLLPRCFPRREQLIRAERMQAAGLAQCLPQATAAELRTHLHAALEGGIPTGALPDLSGSQRLAVAITELGRLRRHVKSA
jgi:predicted glycosyltransferase